MRDMMVLCVRHITMVMMVQPTTVNYGFSRIFSVHQVTWLTSCTQNAHLVDLLDFGIRVRARNSLVHNYNTNYYTFYKCLL